MEDPTALLDAVRASAARFAASVSALTEAQARGPSALPGWSRSHVLTHVARSADVYTWLLGSVSELPPAGRRRGTRLAALSSVADAPHRVPPPPCDARTPTPPGPPSGRTTGVRRRTQALARTGAEPGPRADAAILERRLREGAERPAAALVADLRGSLDRLFDEAAAMPAERWSVLVSALAGWKHPAWFTLHRARRELEVHHADLALGHTPAAWPAGFVEAALDETVAALAARGFPVARIEATDLRRSWTLAPTGPTVTGPGHALLAWLAGRGPAPDAHPEGPLPAPPPWPLPPVPGWG